MLRARRSLIRRHPEFAKLWAGDLVSVFGSAITTVALPLTAVVVLRAGAFQMGLLAAAGTLPPLLFGLVAGVWIDRLPRRSVLIVGDVGRALLLGMIPALAVLGRLRIEILYAVEFLVGLLSFLFLVATASVTPALVDREDLMQANSATALNSSVGSTAGPALAGALVQLLTAPIAIAVDAVSFVLSAVFTILIRMPTTASPQPPPRRLRFRSEVTEGLRLLFTGPHLSPIAVSASVGAAGGAMQNALVILFLVRVLHLTPALVGLAAAVSGAASIAGALTAPELSSRLGPGRTYLLGGLLAGTAGLALALAQGPTGLVLLIVAVSQALRGAGPSLYRTSQRTIRQWLVPDRALGRVNASWQFVVIGVQPLGALAGGLIATHAGLRTTIVIGSLGMLLGWGWAVRSPVRKLRRLPAI